MLTCHEAGNEASDCVNGCCVLFIAHRMWWITVLESRLDTEQNMLYFVVQQKDHAMGSLHPKFS